MAILTKKRLRFINAYDGNATEAAKLAGYSDPQTAGSRLMHVPEVVEALKVREMEYNKSLIATRMERQQFWTRIGRDENEKTVDRLTAMRDLGKSEGDFLDRVDHTTGGERFPTRIVIEGVDVD